MKPAHLGALAFFALAAVFYFTAFKVGALVCLVIGVGCEVVAWAHVVAGSDASASDELDRPPPRRWFDGAAKGSR